MRGLGLLSSAVGRPPEISAWSWATVTDDSPLRVQLDGPDDEPELSAPVTLVSGLIIGDRVWVQLVTNADPSRRHRRAFIVGKASGQIIAAGSVTNAQLADMAAQTFKGRVTASTGAPEDLTLTQARNLIQQPNKVCTRFVLAANASSSSTTYADLDASINVSFTKRHASSRVMLRVDGTWFFADAAGGGHMALRIDGTDYPLVSQPQAVLANTRVGFSGADSVSGLAADTYTVQARWRANVAAKAVQMNATDDTVTITVEEFWG